MGHAAYKRAGATVGWAGAVHALQTTSDRRVRRRGRDTRARSWALVFQVTAAVTAFGMVFYLLFASGEKQFD